MDEEISNKGLAVLLVLAIVVSIGGTLISLNRIGTGITGYVTQTGTATLNIQELVQITLTDASVNFGTCALNSSTVLTYISNSTNNQSLEDPASQCSFPDGVPDVFTLENTGNKNVNLTIGSDTSAADFVNAPSQELKTFAFAGMPRIGTGEIGCVEGLQNSFTNFTAAETPYLLCNNFTTVTNADEIDIAFMVTLPPDAASGQRVATITITAENIQG